MKNLLIDTASPPVVAAAEAVRIAVNKQEETSNEVFAGFEELRKKYEDEEIEEVEIKTAFVNIGYTGWRENHEDNNKANDKKLRKQLRLSAKELAIAKVLMRIQRKNWIMKEWQQRTVKRTVRHFADVVYQHTDSQQNFIRLWREMIPVTDLLNAVQYSEKHYTEAQERAGDAPAEKPTKAKPPTADRVAETGILL